MFSGHHILSFSSFLPAELNGLVWKSWQDYNWSYGSRIIEVIIVGVWPGGMMRGVGSVDLLPISSVACAVY